MRIRLIHPVVGRVALIAALMTPIVLPAGAVVCMDEHGRIAIEGADATTGRCAGHAHDHCHVEVDTCCPSRAHDSASDTGTNWSTVDPHGCVDLLIPSDLMRIDRTAAIDLPAVFDVALFVQPDVAAFVFAVPEVTTHPPPWARAPLSTFILLT